jgi:hypothetical protein
VKTENFKDNIEACETRSSIQTAEKLTSSEHGPICHLFELILVIHANTSNGTNHFVYHVFVDIPKSHGCFFKKDYPAFY